VAGGNSEALIEQEVAAIDPMNRGLKPGQGQRSGSRRELVAAIDPMNRGLKLNSRLEALAKDGVAAIDPMNRGLKPQHTTRIIA